MAVVAYLLTHTPNAGDHLIDGIEAMNLAIDDTVDTTTALIKARGVTVARAAGHPVPDGYFDGTPVALTTYDAAGDNTIIMGPVATTIA